jgi:hydrogenase nickel incorporation protein HypA/HybF
MHELSITQSIFDQALTQAKKHKAKKIKKIKLQIGEGTAIVPDCIQFYFDALKTETIAKDSVLDIQTIPVRLRCPKCKKEFGIDAINENLEDKICECNKGVEIISGQEMLIEYIDVE